MSPVWGRQGIAELSLVENIIVILVPLIIALPNLVWFKNVFCSVATFASAVDLLAYLNVYSARETQLASDNLLWLSFFSL